MSACLSMRRDLGDGVWVAIVPLAATAVSREFRGQAFGVMSGALPLGSVTGPLIGGIVGDGLGLGSAFYASSLLFLVSGRVPAVFRRRSDARRQVAG